MLFNQRKIYNITSAVNLQINELRSKIVFKMFVTLEMFHSILIAKANHYLFYVYTPIQTTSKRTDVKGVIEFERQVKKLEKVTCC